MILKMKVKKMLWKRLKMLVANLFAEDFAAHEATEFEARQRLQKLRESELSAGAARAQRPALITRAGTEQQECQKQLGELPTSQRTQGKTAYSNAIDSLRKRP